MPANHRALEESDLVLIERVKQTPSLYDPRNAGFRLAHKKEKHWEDVATSLGLSIADARRRWTCLRDRYSRELKQVRLNPEKGEYGKNEFFRQMDFLRKFVRKRKERRINMTYRYESSWEGSMDDTKLTEVNNPLEIDGEYPNYCNKVEISTSGGEYNELVENVPFEGYAEEQSTGTTNSGDSVKAVNCPSIPMMLQNQAPESATTFGITPQRSRQLEPDPLETKHREQFLQSKGPENLRERHVKAAHTKKTLQTPKANVETEDDFFCKSVAAYLRQLSRRHKIKAKVEMFQILEKYIEIEENGNSSIAIERR